MHQIKYLNFFSVMDFERYKKIKTRQHCIKVYASL